MATRVNGFLKQHRSSASVLQCRSQNQGLIFFAHGGNLRPHLSQVPALRSSTRSFLDFFQLENKKAMAEERARLINDEMNRGYFADIKECKEHGGKSFCEESGLRVISKIAAADKTVIHVAAAMKFPVLAVTLSNGEILKQQPSIFCRVFKYV